MDFSTSFFSGSLQNNSSPQYSVFQYVTYSSFSAQGFGFSELSESGTQTPAYDVAIQ